MDRLHPSEATGSALGAALVFCVLITGSTDAPTDSMSIVLPAILLGAGLLGMAVAAWLRASHPDRYAHIGERTTVEQAEHVA